MNHLYVAYQQNIINNNDGEVSGNRFTARPLKQWRKQYQKQNQASTSNRRALAGMPMDRPGGLVPVIEPQIRCGACKDTIPAKLVISKDSLCTSCNLIKNKVNLTDTTYTNNMSYLQSRCSIYEQKIGTVAVPAVNYFSPNGIALEPSNSPVGPQKRESVNCLNSSCQTTTIYKPNNTAYTQQGGVSSSSRLARLKYNTLNNYPVNEDGAVYNGSVFNTSAGAMGVNSGRYQPDSIPSYFMKYKPQSVSFNRKPGTRLYCNVANTICMSE